MRVGNFDVMGAKQLRRLSFEFSRHVHKDVAKRNLLPAKWLLQGLLAWPDTNGPYATLFNWFCFFNLLTAEIFHVAYMLVHVTDIKEMSAVCTTVITNLEALVRVFIIVLKKRELNEILVTIWQSFWPVDVVKPEKLRAIKLLSIFSLTLNVGFLVSSCTSNTQIVGDPMLKHNLVFKSIFPFEWDRIWLYELLYIWQYFSDWFVLFMVNAFDFLIIAVVMICAVQYMILQEVFRHMLDDEFGQEKRMLFGKDGDRITRMEVLIRCLEQHKMLNRVCEQLESSLSFITLIQFFNSTVAICVSSLVVKVDPKFVIQMLAFLAAHLSQLFYYCFIGNELEFQSSHLADAIYESNWQLFYDKDFSRVLLLMMQRAQRKQFLTAAGITEMDFASYLKVMRISFSFYTLLDTLMKK